MQKGQFWIDESGQQETTEDVNIFCFTGFRFIYNAQSSHPQAFESELAIELE